MQLRLLGPAGGQGRGQPVSVGAAKQRAVLAMLALRRRTHGLRRRLIEGLWGEHPPATAAKLVQQYVSQLRAAARRRGGAAIVTRGRGYELRVSATTSSVRFERLAARARRARRSRCGAAALGDLAVEPFAAPRPAARSAAARGPRARRWTPSSPAAARARWSPSSRRWSQHPLRERLRGQLMLALYRRGARRTRWRRTEARRALVESSGIEPGPDLQRLEREILAQDPALEAPPARANCAAADGDAAAASGSCAPRAAAQPRHGC